MPASPFNLPEIKIYSPTAKPVLNTADSRSPQYRRPGSLSGYTGHVSSSFPANVEDRQDEALSPADKYMIRGYTGFRPERKHTVGEPSIPSEKKQIKMRMEQTLEHSASRTPGHFRGQLSPLGATSPAVKSPMQNNADGAFMETLLPSPSYLHYRKNSSSSSSSNGSSPSTSLAAHEAAINQFRAFAKNMDLSDRYNDVTQQLLARGQSQEMLLRIVQSKLSERVHSYASQQIRTRKLFEAFDLNGDGVLDEAEFRVCLEKMNIQFDDIQALALFAYFDTANQGVIEWASFANNAMVQNPRGATGVLPKMITSINTEPISVASASRFPMFA